MEKEPTQDLLRTPENKVEKERATLTPEEIKEVSETIGQYFIMCSSECAKGDWTVPSGIERFKKLNEIYNKLTGNSGEHFAITNMREQIDINIRKLNENK